MKHSMDIRTSGFGNYYQEFEGRLEKEFNFSEKILFT